MLALLLTLVQSPPAVTVQLNHDNYAIGDRARVYVEAAQDGYLVVLHADPEGRVRVLFPLDPRDDDFVRGGKRFEVRGRADRDGFQIESDEGSGTVLAAVAKDPFTFDSFVRNDHWDFRALGGPSTSVRDDPQAKLVDIVQQMAGDSTGRFEYDVTTYVVNGGRVASRYGYGWGYGGFGGFGGYPFYGAAFYNPFCFDPFFGWSSCFGYGFGYPFGVGVRVGFGFPIVRRFPLRPYRPFTPLVFTRKAEPGLRFNPVPVRPRTVTPNVAPRILSQPRVRSMPRSFSGGSRPTMSRGSGSGRSFGGGRRH